MAVYVDDMEASYGRMVMCHMLADTTDELLAMADKIGVARKWIQKAGMHHEHFDIAKSKRALAIKHGAIEIDRAGLVELLRKRRGQGRSDCWCQTCRPRSVEMRMILCPTCGNKRCPHANDHRNACTGSNEPGQAWSAYA
ncbi:DUF4031 domain-containing protein [Cupriavidus necator]